MKITKALSTMLVFATLAACSSGGTSTTASNTSTESSVSAGTGTGDVAADAQTASTQALTVSTTALTQAFTQASNSSSLVKNARFATIETLTGDCDPSGTWTLNGNYDDDLSDGIWDYDFVIGYDDCGGIDGELSYVGQYTFSDDNFSYSSVINGEIGGYGCITTYSDLSYLYTFNLNDSTFTGLINGSYDAECDTSSVSCTFDNVDIFDVDTYLNSCTVDGQPVEASTDTSTEEDDSTESTTLTFTDEISNFFADNAGSYEFVAATREGNTQTTFTDGGTYTINLTAGGAITVDANGSAFVMYFDPNGHFFETSASESTFVWKDSDDNSVTLQNQGGNLTLVVGVNTGSDTFDFWDLSEAP